MYLKTMEFSISTLKIEEKIPSLKQVIPNGEVTGTYLNCNYTISPDEGRLVISGKNEQEMLKCAKSITRILSRRQNWGFYYDLRRFKTTDDDAGEGRVSRTISRTVTDVSMKNSLQSAFDSKAAFEGQISKEHELPAFFDLLFQEAVFNKSMKKNRIAFILAFSTLENAVKLLCMHHCEVRIKSKSPQFLFEKLEQDSTIQLKADVSDFDDGSRFKKIRNDIAHGGSKYEDKDIKEDLDKLLFKVDEILGELSPFLVQYEQHL